MKQVNSENYNHEGLLQATMTNQQTFHKELYKEELPWDNQGLPVSKISTKLCTSCEGRRYCHLRDNPFHCYYFYLCYNRAKNKFQNQISKLIYLVLKVM